MGFEMIKKRNVYILTMILATAYWLFYDTLLFSVDTTKYDSKISSNHHYDCIYCKITQNNNYSTLCANHVFPSSNDTRLFIAKKLMLQTNYLKQCPINYTDALYQYISPIIESTSTIFHQISSIENGEEIIYNSNSTTPPKWIELPTKLQNAYTFNNSIPMLDWYIDNDIQNANTQYKLNWSKRRINAAIRRFKKTGKIIAAYHCPYGPKPANDFYHLLTDSKYSQFIKDSNSIVIGSQFPWLEILLLASGVSTVTTAEYGTINAEHPQMKWIHPSEFNENYTDIFDVAVQFSSLEHAGLGRYGDPMDPIGDIKMMNQISCLVKPNGLLFYGGPTSDDCIAWNAHRYYGSKRLRLMFMHWRIIDVIGDFNLMDKCVHDLDKQPWFVLQNKRGCFSG
eukprot:286707_1